ncbi:hypothetical protein, variant [Aphanomyces invadans]|uniref:Amino acid permease/ SLC12A domain-containing protein n=1 Tax=Aphanomyces invadans TaxID=157072 RepID=A0A024UA10_9STRA|nr:hypothetical protein, variant [Aphanomyces invadans]ETW02413.1 hypothetical protein, variant [Aphanomyces invadans]|eukprot:XP_008869018.1 hypothetical protein, variant [Aphanomyces invadans]
MEVLAVATDSAATRRQLGLVPVVVLTFLSVCGGPFGSEEIVSACGPLIGLSALAVFPIVYSLPMNLLLAELCSAFPVDSSFCAWVELAFGSSWGFFVGYWSWMASTFDAAVYPCLVVDALFVDATVGDSTVWVTKTGLRVLFLTVFMVPTLFSLDFIGKASKWLTGIVLLPFGVLVLVALPQMRWSNVIAISPTMQWSRLVSVLFWNFRGFDAMGAYAGEIQAPQINLNRAMVASLLMITATYMLPLVAAVGVNKPVYWTWVDGSFPAIAGAVAGGSWLAQWVAAANAFSSFGLYFAESSANGFRLAGMADVGLAPQFFSHRDKKTGSPRRALLFIYSVSVARAMCWRINFAVHAR